MGFFNNENIVYLESADFDDRGALKDSSIDSTKPVLIMIYGEQCPHCHRVMPDFIQLSKDKQLSIYAAVATDGEFVDVDLIQKLKNVIPDLRGVPTFVLYRNGRYIKTHRGARTSDSLRKFIES